MHKGKGPGRETWLTPGWILDIVRDTLGGPIGLDPATTGQNPTDASRFYTPVQNGLELAWTADSVFLNPPWSVKKGLPIRPWLRRAQMARRSQLGGPCPQMFILVAAAMNAQWTHAFLSDADAYFFPRGRVAYVDPDTLEIAASPGFDSVLCYWGANLVRFRQSCGDRGKVLS